MQKQNKQALNHFSIQLQAVKGKPKYFFRDYFPGFRHGSKMNYRMIPITVVIAAFFCASASNLQFKIIFGRLINFMCIIMTLISLKFVHFSSNRNKTVTSNSLNYYILKYLSNIKCIHRNTLIYSSLCHTQCYCVWKIALALFKIHKHNYKTTLVYKT